MASMALRDRLGGAAKSAAARPANVQIERELEVLTRWMDNRFRIPGLGWHFGLNALFDLVPGIGDTATSLVALYVLASAVRYRVSKITVLRMGVNIAIYFVVGLIPWIGDLFDAWWKPNVRNVDLLRRRATASPSDAKRGRTSDWLFVGFIMLALLGMLFGSFAVSVLLVSWLARGLGAAVRF